MRIAISGTHFMGKTTLIKDFIVKHPKYRHEIEPFYKLQEESVIDSSFASTIEDFLEYLDYSIDQLNILKNESNIIFDRCPIDHIAYAMYVANQDMIDVRDSEISERFDEVQEALNNLDLIIFLPITEEHLIEYTEDDPYHRKMVDKYLKKIYRDDLYNLLPNYNQPKIVEIYGTRATRIKKLEIICNL